MLIPNYNDAACLIDRLTVEGVKSAQFAFAEETTKVSFQQKFYRQVLASKLEEKIKEWKSGYRPSLEYRTFR